MVVVQEVGVAVLEDQAEVNPPDSPGLPLKFPIHL